MVATAVRNNALSWAVFSLRSMLHVCLGAADISSRADSKRKYGREGLKTASGFNQPLFGEVVIEAPDVRFDLFGCHG